MELIGVDTGGTFTDFIFKSGEKWGVLKRESTPDNPARAVIAGLGDIAGGISRRVVHGSTVATNALLKRKGGKRNMGHYVASIPPYPAQLHLSTFAAASGKYRVMGCRNRL